MDIEAWIEGPVLKKDSIYGLLDSCGDRLMKDEDFVELHSSTGRPSVSPALLSKVLLLILKLDYSQKGKPDIDW